MKNKVFHFRASADNTGFKTLYMAVKKIFIKLIVNFFKGLIKFKQALIFLWSKIIVKFLGGVLKIVYHWGGRFFILKIYSCYLLLKRSLLKFYKPEKNKFLYHLTNRYLVHLVIILIALTITFNNIKAKNEIRTEEFGKKSILYSLISEGGEEIIEETAAPDQPTVEKETKIFSYLDSPAGLKAPLEQPGATEESLEEITTTTGGGSALVKPNINITNLADKLRTDVEYYVVQEGDTLGEIAENFGISVNTILWENNIKSWQYLKPGQKLTVLPTSGLSHEVKKGETLTTIAKKYKVDSEKILAFNELASVDQVRIGQKLIIPEGEMPAPPRAPQSALEKLFIPSRAQMPPGDKMFWPTLGSRITQYFTWRHAGIDIANAYNTPVYAADDGRVSQTGWGRGYGWQIVIDHGNGIKTRYAHLSKILVQNGQVVAKGKTIGLMGSSGWSTGPHVHFEVIVNGVAKNPLPYIR